MVTINWPTGNNLERFEPTFKFLMIIYATLFTVSIVLLNEFEVRSLLYYIVVCALSVVVLIEILGFKATDKKTAVIMLQIMLLTLNVIWSMTLKYYDYIGRTDVIGHTYYAESLLNYGHITSAMDIYRSFPLWHILSSSLYMISGLSVDMSKILFIASGLVYMFLPVAVYLVMLKLSNTKSLAMVSALMTSLSPVVLIYGSYAIPRSVASFFFIVLVLLILKQKDKAAFTLSIFFTFAIIAYHTVSIVFVLAILVLMYVLQAILIKNKNDQFIQGKYLLASIGMTVVYWLAFANDLVTWVLGNLFSSAPPGLVTKSVINMPISELLNYIQYTPYLFFIILGAVMVMRSNKFSDSLKLFSLTALLLIVLSFPGPLMLINKFASNFDLDRFEEYTFLFMGLAAAVGLVFIYHRSGTVMKAFCVLLFASFVLLSVSNDFVASDNPLVKRPFYTDYLTENEVSSFNLLPTLDTGSILSDYVTIRYYEFSPYVSMSMPLNVDYKNGTFLKGNRGDIIVIRQDELNNRPLKLLSADSDRYVANGDRAKYDFYYEGDPVYNTLGTYNKVYDSRSVEFFR